MPGSSFGIARSSKRAPRPAVVHELGQRVGQAARADVVDRERSGCRRRAPSSGRSPPGSGAASRRCRAAPRRSRGPRCDAPCASDDAAPPPRPISIAGPPSTTSGAPAGISPFWTCAGADVAEAAREHDRLVVAAHLAPAAVDLELEGAEVAERGGPAELVVERGAAERAVDHDVERASRCAPGLPSVALPRLRARPGCAGCETDEAGEAGLGLARRGRSRPRRGSRRPSRWPRPGTARSRSGGCASRPSSGCAPARACAAVDAVARSGKKRSAAEPSITAALSLYADSTPAGARLGAALDHLEQRARPAARRRSTNSALKILWRQCSLLACANIISSTSVGIAAELAEARRRR